MPQRRTLRRREASPEPVWKINPGDPVEVLPDEPGLRGAHFTAVFVARSTDPRGYTVEYDARFKPEGSDRPLREVVPARILRPQRPRCWAPGLAAPAEHAAVDALLNGAWWLGVALGGADGNGKVRVCFPDIREVVEFDTTEVRPHLEWGHDGWRRRSAEGMAKPETVPYTKRMKIEVSKLEDNSVVAWLPAVVGKTFWKNNLLVEYTASKSYGTALPEEIVDVKHVRPCPPQASAISFCINDEVEAFQGGGWCLGVITDVHPELRYTFKSAHLGVEVQLSQKLLRPRYDWVYVPWKQESKMGHGRKKADSPKIQSESPVAHGKGKRKAVPRAPQHSCGRGKTTAGQRSRRPRIKQASTSGAFDEGEDHRKALKFLEEVIHRMQRPIRVTDAGEIGVHVVDYKKGKHDIYVLRYSDPSGTAKEFKWDVRFWKKIQADWYESVILCKTYPTTEMKSINWNCILDIDLEAVQEAKEACAAKDMYIIMAHNKDWNEEIIAQFYSTLYVDRTHKIMHWTIQGKPFSVGYPQFAAILGFSSADLNKEKIHEVENVLVDAEMEFMYDSAYGEIVLGTIKGMKPFYKMLNQLLRYTLCPKAGDSDNVSSISKNLLARMAPNARSFSVFDFIWEEIILCSVSPKKSCHYAPYIFTMICEVTELNILADKGHQVYKPKKGQLQRLLKLGSHAPTAPSEVVMEGPLPPFGSSAPQGPSSSHGPSRAPNTKGFFNLISQGLKACSAIGKHNAEKLRAHRIYMDKELLKIEKRQKDFMDENAIPHSPLREPMEFPSPPHFYNPWEDMGSSSMYGPPPFDDVDLGGREEEEEEAEEEDVLAANTPSDEE